MEYAHKESNIFDLQVTERRTDLPRSRNSMYSENLFFLKFFSIINIFRKSDRKVQIKCQHYNLTLVFKILSNFESDALQTDLDVSAIL